MDVREAIDKAGGPNVVAIACCNRGYSVKRTQVSTWKARNELPMTEWKAKTRYAEVICDLIVAMGHDEIFPIDICPGAGQYMVQPDSEAA